LFVKNYLFIIYFLLKIMIMTLLTDESVQRKELVRAGKSSFFDMLSAPKGLYQWMRGNERFVQERRNPFGVGNP